MELDETSKEVITNEEIIINENAVNDYGQGYIITLSVIAGFLLLFGFDASMVIWATVENRNPDGYSISTQANSAGILLGLEVLITAIVLWSFFMVVCKIAKRVITMRKSLEN